MKQHKKNLFVSVAILIVLGLFLSPVIFNKKFNKKEESPQVVVKKTNEATSSTPTIAPQMKVTLSTTTPNSAPITIVIEPCDVGAYDVAACFGSGRIGPMTYGNIALYDLVSTDSETGFGIVVDEGEETLLFRVRVTDSNGAMLMPDDYAFYRDYIVNYFKNKKF